MNSVNALNTYKNVGLESGVAAANPHQLILMLYQGALLAIASAKNQILRKQISAKGSSITKAIKIIDEGLKACLDVKQGGEIGKNLYDLYDYMNQRLLIANLKNDIAAKSDQAVSQAAHGRASPRKSLQCVRFDRDCARARTDPGSDRALPTDTPACGRPARPKICGWPSTAN